MFKYLNPLKNVIQGKHVHFKILYKTSFSFIIITVLNKFEITDQITDQIIRP